MITQKLAELDPNELPFIDKEQPQQEFNMVDKEMIEIKVVLKAIKGKIEIFREMQIKENENKSELRYPYLYGASEQTLASIETIIDQELSNIESKD